MTNIPTELIERALRLTGKTLGDVCDIPLDIDISFEFSYPKFYAYLLSEDFIKKYADATLPRGKTYSDKWFTDEFGKAIYEHQKGNSGPLISLLEKI